MSARLSWDRDGRDWPHREASRFVEAGGLRWHVQHFLRKVEASGGDSASQASPNDAPSPAIATTDAPAPLALLLHGTGASSHSWHPMLPLLRPHLDLLLVDLPGHAFTSMAQAWQASLPGMAQAVGALLRELQLQPATVIGHSAGAALGARMCLDGHTAPHTVISINGAFLPLGGIAGVLFPPAAKLMAALPFIPRFVAKRATDRGAIERLVSGTGSKIDAAGTALYAKLVGNPGHVAGALLMMANWDVRPLLRDMPRLQPTLVLLSAEKDVAVPPAQAEQVRAMLPPDRVTLTRMVGLGHLAHEEQPARVTRLCLQALNHGRLSPPAGWA